MTTYKYNVDTTISQGNSTVTTSFGFDTEVEALKCFNESVETRRRSHVPGQLWDVTLHNMARIAIVGHISSTDF